MNRPRRSGPPSDYGTQPVLSRPNEKLCVGFQTTVYSRPAQLRALARWLVKIADFMDQEEKE